MSDYISREDIQAQIVKAAEKCKIKLFDKSVNVILQILQNMPAADVQPVKHGRWINIYEYCKERDLRPTGLGVYYWCSECGEAEKKTSDFCPNCGARMQKGGDVQSVDTENMATVSDEFICKKCRIYLKDYIKVVMDEDNAGYIDEQHYEYEPKFCPECGAKVKEGDTE